MNRIQYLFEKRTYPLANVLVLAEAENLLAVLLGQLETGKDILLLVDIVSLQNGGKDWESVGRVQCNIKVVPVHSRNFLFPPKQINKLHVSTSHFGNRVILFLGQAQDKNARSKKHIRLPRRVWRCR